MAPNIKPKAKQIINEHIFGNNNALSDSDPKQGISHLKVASQELGSIPGLLEHWHLDIERRKQHINTWKEQSFMKKAVDVLRHKQSAPQDATGIELYNLHPSKAAKDALKKIRLNPTDSMARLELVSIIGKSGRELPIEVFRTLYLQAATALCFGELGMTGLQIALWSQETYFSKLFYKCKNEASSLDAKLQNNGEKNIYTVQSNELRKRIGAIQRNMDIIKIHQDHAKNALKTVTSKNDLQLGLRELDDFLLSNKHELDKKKKLFHKSTRLLLLLRAIPLLHDEGAKYIEKLRKIDSHEPLLHFLNAKLHMSKLVFLVGQYESGDRRSEVRQQIQERFKHTYHEYGLAVRKVGKLPKLPIDFTILIEYANLVHYFYRVAVDVLNLRLPKEWLHTAFKKAQSALTLADDSGNTADLYLNIVNDMAHAGIIE